jgi:arginase family enzyme
MARAPGHGGDVRDLPAAWRGRRLVAQPDLLLESHDGGHATVANAVSGARLKLSSGLYRILCRFESPRTFDEAFGEAGDPLLVTGVGALLERGLLLDAERPMPAAQPLRRAVPYRFCNAPRGAAPDDGFVVLGVPYDLGGPGQCRDAPRLIRQKSLDYAYLLDFDTGRPRGWFDATSGERILQGVALADAEDVHVVYGEGQADTFARVETALNQAVGARGVPLLLGGDRSLCYVLARHLAARQSLAVLQFAPDTTMAHSEGEVVTVRDVGRRTAGLEGVVSCTTLGIRAGAPAAGEIVVAAARARGLAETVWEATVTEAVLLALDVNVMDIGMPPDGSGFSMGEMRSLIDAVGHRHRIVGIGIFGLDADGTAEGAVTGDLLGIVACQLALHAMHCASRTLQAGS